MELSSELSRQKSPTKVEFAFSLVEQVNTSIANTIVNNPKWYENDQLNDAMRASLEQFKNRITKLIEARNRQDPGNQGSEDPAHWKITAQRDSMIAERSFPSDNFPNDPLGSPRNKSSKTWMYRPGGTFTSLIICVNRDSLDSLSLPSLPSPQ